MHMKLLSLSNLEIKYFPINFMYKDIMFYCRYSYVSDKETVTLIGYNDTVSFRAGTQQICTF